MWSGNPPVPRKNSRNAEYRMRSNRDKATLVFALRWRTPREHFREGAEISTRGACATKSYKGTGECLFPFCLSEQIVSASVLA
jgi:hypothetical protein